MYKYSIIVPVYNTHSDYLMQCLNSVEQQTYDNFECIIVNDCSSDHNTIKFIQNWMKDKPNKYKLIHNELNSGPGISRNIGVRNAAGEFIVFLDADDYLEQQMLATVDKYVSRHRNLDILSFNASWLYDDKLQKIMEKSDGWQSYTLTNVNISHGLVKDKTHIWSKCYAKNFLIEKDIWHLNRKESGDNLYFHIVAYSKANQIYVIDEPLYICRRGHATSLTSQTNLKEQILNAMDYAFKAFETIRKDDSIISRYFYIFFKYFFETAMTGSQMDTQKQVWWSEVYERFNKMYRWLIEIGH